MLVHVLSPDRDARMSRMSAAAVAQSLRAHDVDVVVSGVTEFLSGDAGGGHTRSRSSDAPTPDIVHSLGTQATIAALDHTSADTPVVATFAERPTSTAAEAAAAQRVSGLVTLSQEEQGRWLRSLRRRVPVVTVPLSAPRRAAEPSRSITPERGVMCMSDGNVLDCLLESMPQWGPHPLIVVARSEPSRYRHVMERAELLGVADRIVWRDPASGESVWADAGLLVAGPESARDGAAVLAAATRRLPVVASPQEAHLDLVVPGSTGLLMDPCDDPDALGAAIETGLDGGTWQSWGEAAQERCRCGNAPEVLGARLLSFYGRVLGWDAPPSLGEQPLSPEGHQLVADHLSLARSLASRYAMGNHNSDDLIQVASMGLVLAARRFDPSRGVPFAAYAKPTIVGELRRYFRDHGWSVRVPRGLQELAVDVHRVEGDGLSNDCAIAAELDVAEQEVVQARQARQEALTSKSLDYPLADDSGGVLGDLLGQRDPELELVEQREALHSVLPQVPARERRILMMRFFAEKSQAEIADLLGVSQVHVSRLLNRTLKSLRDHLCGDEALPAAWTQVENTAGRL